MKLKLGVVMDPIHTINPKKDTTLALLLEAQRRHYHLHYMTPADLFWQQGMAQARMQSLQVTDSMTEWFTLDDHDIAPLSHLDVILMRVDPPFNMQYIYTTYLLETAESEGTRIINKPQALRDANEKLFITHFSNYCPETLVSCDAKQIKAFIKAQQHAVLKPLDSMGGRSIYLVNDGDLNTNVIIETLTAAGQRFIMVQQYIPEIRTKGDKRILLINGKPIPYALARMPAEGDLRGNLAAGGHGVGVEITDRDREICAALAPTLKAKGLFFVGIDVIGDYLTEINVTSPTCMREINHAFNIDIAATFFDSLELLIKHQKR